MNIWALSGFLGLPSDWDLLQIENLIAVDWQAFPLKSLSEWARTFNHWVVDRQKEGNVLMGYSLGGRLALHALIDRPSLWDAAIIVSAHPGLIEITQRNLRKKKDLEWARRFEREDWSRLIGDWNKQDVFAQDSFSLTRKEFNYQRSLLAQALKGGSLGGQENLRGAIASLPMPILWITGSLDFRYCELAEILTFSHSLSRWKSIEGAGHRVPWSQRKSFSEVIAVFFNDLQR